MTNLPKVTNKWLEDANAEFDNQGIDRNNRAEAAIRKWRRETAGQLVASEDLHLEVRLKHSEQQFNKIRSYFLTQSNRYRGYIRPQFSGIYFFHGDFWEVVIPLIMGSPKVDAFKFLLMPAELHELLASDQESAHEYIAVFADSFDYGYAIEEVESRCRSDFSKQLFRSADKHIRAAVLQLFQKESSTKAIEDTRMAVEILLKAYLSVVDGLIDEDFRKQFGHDLEKLIDKCISNGVTELTPIRSRLDLFPNISSRYTAKELTYGELWTTYRITLITAAAILRNLTGRDCRKAFGLI